MLFLNWDIIFYNLANSTLVLAKFIFSIKARLSAQSQL